MIHKKKAIYTSRKILTIPPDAVPAPPLKHRSHNRQRSLIGVVGSIIDALQAALWLLAVATDLHWDLHNTYVLTGVNIHRLPTSRITSHVPCGVKAAESKTFWVGMPCSSEGATRFERKTWPPIFRADPRKETNSKSGQLRLYFSTLKTDVIRISETWGFLRTTQLYSPVNPSSSQPSLYEPHPAKLTLFTAQWNVLGCWQKSWR
jgi:hypothetical protein